MRRTWIGLVSLLVAAGGCGTDAEGTGDCRALERARCQAAAACGYPDVDECIRFQRDQCLHGVALDSIAAGALDGCVQDIERVGRCAAGQGGDALAAGCSEPVQTVGPTVTACDVVQSPERAASCAFLAPNAAPPAAVAGDGGA